MMMDNIRLYFKRLKIFCGLMKNIIKKNLVVNILIVILLALGFFGINYNFSEIFQVWNYCNVFPDKNMYMIDYSKAKGEVYDFFEKEGEQYSAFWDGTAQVGNEECYAYALGKNIDIPEGNIKKGSSFIKQGECIIGGALAKIYDIGDEIKVVSSKGDENTFKVVGIIKSPVYLMDFMEVRSGFSEVKKRINEGEYVDWLRFYRSVCVFNEGELNIKRWNETDEKIGAYVFDEKPDIEALKKSGCKCMDLSKLKKSVKAEYQRVLLQRGGLVLAFIGFFVIVFCMVMYYTMCFSKDIIEIFTLHGATPGKIDRVILGESFILMLISFFMYMFAVVVSQRKVVRIYSNTLLIQGSVCVLSILAIIICQWIFLMVRRKITRED